MIQKGAFPPCTYGAASILTAAELLTRHLVLVFAEIQESVERADTKLLEYEVVEQEQSEQLKMELAAIEDSQELMLTMDDIGEMIPAAGKEALYRVAEAHDESMKQLIGIYRDLDPGTLGEKVEEAATDDFMEAFASAQDLVNDVLAHREVVQGKVEAAKASLQTHQENLRAAELAELEEMGMDAEPTPGGLGTSAPTTAGGTQDGGGGSTKIAALKEHIRLLEGRVGDLQAELSEEQQNFQDMEETKDGLISTLNMQIEKFHEQMENVMGATAHELADSAAAVEDTRLHIAYLTVQLRNARELADARNFDVNKWVKREDLEAAVKQINSMKAQVAKLTARVKAEQQNTDEAHAYAKKCLHAKEQADLSHANWETKLRETLKTRDQDLVNLNFETRLLHSRADKLVQEVEETKVRLEKEKKEAVDQAMTAMEDQRQAFNVILRERDATIKDLKSSNQELCDSLAVMTHRFEDMSQRYNDMSQKYDDHVEAVRKAEEDRLLRQVHAEMLTDPVEFGTGKSKDTPEAGAEPSSVKAVLWKVLRRKFAIEAIGALDRQGEKMVRLEQQLAEMEDGLRNKWYESQGVLQDMTGAIQTGFTSIPDNLNRLSHILSSLEACAEREEVALQKRALLKASVTRAMDKMRSSMGELLDAEVIACIDAERVPHSRADEDSAVFEEVHQKLLSARREIEEFQSGGADLEEKISMFTAELQNLFDGEELQSITACRHALTQELQMSQRFDLTHHRKCLTAVTAGDFADTLPTSAGGAILSHPHQEESMVLGKIIKEWNRQKGEWVKERFKLIQDSMAARRDLQTVNMDRMQGDGGSRPSTQVSKPGKKNPYVAENATFELALYRSSSGNLESEMDALTSAIKNWWHQNNDYEFVDIEADEGVAVPSLWRSCLRLVQASSLAFQSAQARPSIRPQTGQSDLFEDGEEDEVVVEEDVLEEEEEKARDAEEVVELRCDVIEAEIPGEAPVAEVKDEQLEHKEKKRRDKDKDKDRDKDKKKHRHKDKATESASTAHQSQVPQGTGVDKADEKRIKILHTNNSAIWEAVQTIEQRFFPPASIQHLATCPGCLAHSIPPAAAVAVVAETAEEGDAPAPHQNAFIAGKDGLAASLGQGGDRESGEAVPAAAESAVEMKADESAVGAPDDSLGAQVSDHPEGMVSSPAEDGENSVGVLDSDIRNGGGQDSDQVAAEAEDIHQREAQRQTAHTYVVETLKARMADWQDQPEHGDTRDAPTETCIHGHGKSFA